MKKPNHLILGLLGGLAMAIAPGLACGGFYVSAAIVFIGGLAIIDWNRNGQ